MKWTRASDFSQISDCGRYKVSKSMIDKDWRYLCWERAGKYWNLMDIPYQTSFQSAAAAINQMEAAA